MFCQQAYVIAWLKQRDSVNDDVQVPAVDIDQRDVVRVETIAAWCWVEWHVNAGVNVGRYHRRTRHPTSNARLAYVIVCAHKSTTTTN